MKEGNIMKKYTKLSLIVLLVVGLFFIYSPTLLADQSQIKLSVNNQQVQLDFPPVAINGRTFFPVRVLSNSLGVTNDNILWDGINNTVTLIKDDKVIQMKIGDTRLFVNGKVTIMDISPEIIEGKTMLPVSYVASALGFDVSWDGDTQTVKVGVGNTVNNTNTTKTFTIAEQEKQEFTQFTTDTFTITKELMEALQNNSSNSELSNIRVRALQIRDKINLWPETNPHYKDAKKYLISICEHIGKVCFTKTYDKPLNDEMRQAVLQDEVIALNKDVDKLLVEIERLKKWGDY